MFGAAITNPEYRLACAGYDAIAVDDNVLAQMSRCDSGR
jgi:hypothetical protein